MSTTIDERVVEMRFDNKQFESNVQTSLSTLDRLKKSLNLSGAAKGFDEIDSASKKVNMNGLANAVESVRLKFSALEVMAVTALANITNSALNAGKRIVSALTIDPIKTGFQDVCFFRMLLFPFSSGKIFPWYTDHDRIHLAFLLAVSVCLLQQTLNLNRVPGREGSLCLQ